MAATRGAHAVELSSLDEFEPALAAEQSFDAARVFIGYGATAPSAPEPCVLPTVAYSLDPPREPRGDFRVGEWRTTWSEDEYARAIETVRAAIFEGDVYQVNLVQHMCAPFAGRPHRLRAVARPFCRSGAARCARARSRGRVPPACTSNRRRTPRST